LRKEGGGGEETNNILIHAFVYEIMVNFERKIIGCTVSINFNSRVNSLKP